MTGLLARPIFAKRSIVIAVDRPFTETVKAEPTGLAKVLANFGTEGGRQ